MAGDAPKLKDEFSSRVLFSFNFDFNSKKWTEFQLFDSSKISVTVDILISLFAATQRNK